jgi:hypothetical protein
MHNKIKVHCCIFMQFKHLIIARNIPHIKKIKSHLGSINYYYYYYFYYYYYIGDGGFDTEVPWHFTPYTLSLFACFIKLNVNQCSTVRHTF